MRIEVDGEEISPEQVSKALGWKIAGEKLRQKGEDKLSLTPSKQAGQHGAEATNGDSQRGGALGGATGESPRHWKTGSRSRARGGSSRRKNAEKKVGWTDRSPVALANEKEFPPLKPPASPPPATMNQNTETRKECGECAEVKKLIEKQNTQIQLQNMQIRALMEKMDALASGRAAARAVKPNEAFGDANAKRKVPRRDPPSSSIAPGEASPSTSAQPNQEEMDAETSRREETATPQCSLKEQPPQGGDMAAILAAINQITEQYGVIRAELQATETQVKGMSVKQERQAAKMVAMTAKSRFAALKKSRTSRIKETVASRCGRVTTS
ncbi:hypothetical protein HPB48_000364 [Haemaphysalis longicornis]|uniref:Uncharacterized protein n=1 Tax=Haemaphysalis longicornis TaxID=44386 RepID=A0A9J6FSF3_HAELO|nr:hypothetical protein HPB48_000364 [Haemaphysalis longicornis]